MDLFDFNHLEPVGETLESWCKKYGLRVKEEKCFGCDEIVKMDVPAFGKEWRGLVAGPCKSCGKVNNFQHFVLTKDSTGHPLINLLS